MNFERQLGTILLTICKVARQSRNAQQRAAGALWQSRIERVLNSAKSKDYPTSQLEHADS